MPKIDWSKPIEVYNPYSPTDTPDPAEIITMGLRGPYPVGIKWSTSGMDCLVNASHEGEIADEYWQVRNAPSKKYILLSKRRNPGENLNDPRVVVLYNSYEEAEANCDASHKVVEVTYEL